MENIHVDLHPRKKMQYTYVVRYCILSLTIKDFLVKYFAKKKVLFSLLVEVTFQKYILCVHVHSSTFYVYMYIQVHSMCTCTFKYILCVHVHSSTFYVYMYIQVHSMCTCTFKYILCVHVHSSTFCVTILAVDNTCFFM